MAAFGNIVTRIKALITADNKDLKKKLKETRSETKKTGDAVGSMGKLIKAAMGTAVVAGAVKLVKNMANVRMEFERYNAMLKVALGSQDAASASMQQLTKFAADTPFQLNQLTGAYVKLVNQGFKPTTEQMTKMGDLASAMGKDYDQLTEAIIDAQTGEFERLKEFGIRASKSGDQVTFAFKEVETQVDFTASSIRDYVVGLGGMEGVSGSMAEISQTLGGRVSNLGDAWDSLMNTMGSKSSGVMVTVINWMIDVANGMQLIVKGAKELRSEAWKELGSDIEGAMAEIEGYQQSAIRGGMDAAKAEQKALEYYKKNINERIKAQELLVNNGEKRKKKEQAALENELLMLETNLSAVEAHYTERGLLEQKALDAYKATVDAQAKIQREADKKEADALTKKLAMYDEAAAAFEKAILSQATAATVAAMETVKLDVATVGVVNTMSKIPETGALAALGVQNYGIANATAAQQAVDNQSALNAANFGYQALAATVMNTTDAVVMASSQAGASMKDLARAAVGAAKQTISAAINQGIAGIVSSALTSIPFPFGLIAAGIAGGAAAALFNMAIPSFAEGGMVTGPTLAMVGDNASGREMIIPWEKLGDMGGGTVEVGGVLKGSNTYLMNKRYADKLSRTGR